MLELRLRFHGDAAKLQKAQVRVEPDAAETDDDPDARQRGDLGVEVRKAVRDFFRRRLVVRWRAADGCRDERVFQRQTVLRMARSRNVGEAGSMKRRHQEVAGAAS